MLLAGGPPHRDAAVPVGPYVLILLHPKGTTVTLSHSPTVDTFDLSSFGFEFVEGGVA